jgi:hypothetical protein|tara:strand:- start:896 stop:1174 length:279 start_codon:yes stop_codon:yes gene_type:complete
MDKFLLYSLVGTHFIVILFLFIIPFYLIINEPFWIWLPINIWIMHLMFSPVLVCPATVWENRLRRKLGMVEIKTFFLHYFINPLKKIINEIE